MEKCCILSCSYFNLEAVIGDGRTILHTVFQRSQCSVPALDTLWDYNSLSAKCLLFLTRTCVLFFICSDDNLVTTSLWSWWGTHTWICMSAVQFLTLTTVMCVLQTPSCVRIQNHVWVSVQFFMDYLHRMEGCVGSVGFTCASTYHYFKLLESRVCIMILVCSFGGGVSKSL